MAMARREAAILRYNVYYRDKFETLVYYTTTDRPFISHVMNNKNYVRVYLSICGMTPFCLTGFKDYEPNPYTKQR